MGIVRDMVSSTIMKEVNIEEIGSIIKCMGKESSNMLMAELLMKGNGMRISFMVMVSYIMKHLGIQIECWTTETLKNYKIIGSITMENFRMTINQDQEA